MNERSISDYGAFLQKKRPRVAQRGLDKVPELNSGLFDYQANVTEFALRAGSSASFLDTGLGKTFVQLEWARVINQHENKPVLILTPLAVAAQTVREAEKFGIEAKAIRKDADVFNGLNVINYEMLHTLDLGKFAGVVLDESSILKSFTGVTTRQLISKFDSYRWKLAATATPAPNDHMELGQHAEFLSVMRSNEMLARWFIADQEQMGRYRLKGHANKSFWEWVASWARCIGKPSDLGYSDDGFVLPPLNVIKHVVQADLTQNSEGMLFRIPDTSATSIHNEKRLTCESRAEAVASIIKNDPNEPWIIWCDTDYEADALMEAIPNAIEVRGSMNPVEKEEKLVAFSTGQAQILITKPSLAGFGLNWQHCARVAFIGLSFSYEAYYQAIRRCWRFGQKRPVDCHIVMADTENAILSAISRKQSDHELMKSEMFAAMKRASMPEKVKHEYNANVKMEMPSWLKAA